MLAVNASIFFKILYRNSTVNFCLKIPVLLLIFFEKNFKEIAVIGGGFFQLWSGGIYVVLKGSL